MRHSARVTTACWEADAIVTSHGGYTKFMNGADLFERLQEALLNQLTHLVQIGFLGDERGRDREPRRIDPHDEPVLYRRFLQRAAEFGEGLVRARVLHKLYAA